MAFIFVVDFAEGLVLATRRLFMFQLKSAKMHRAPEIPKLTTAVLMEDCSQKRATSWAVMTGDLVEVTAHLDIEVDNGVDGIPRASVYLSFSKVLRIEADCTLRKRIQHKVSA